MTEAAPRGLTRLVIRGVALAGGGYVLTQVITLGSYLVLARLADPQDFGDFAAGSVLMAVGFMFSESGMVAAIVQRPDRLEESAATAVVSTLLSGTLFSLMALAASPLIGDFFDSDRIGDVAAAMSGVLFLAAVPIVPTALLQRRFSFLRRMIVQPAQAVVFGVVAIIACSNGMGVWGLVLGTYAQMLADVLLSWGLARWWPKLRLASFALWRELIGYGRHVFAATAVVHVGSQVPVALIGRYVGAGALGQYRYADRIASTPFALTLAAASYVIFPAFARIAAEPERLRAAFIRALRWMAVVGFPSGLILVALGKPLMILVFGSRWAEAGEATMALCMLPAAGALFSVVCEVFTANGNPKLLRNLVLVQFAAGAVAMVALLPFDLIGVAAGVSIGAVVGALYALRVAHRELDVSFASMRAEIAPPLLAALAMAAIMTPVELLVVDAASHGTAAGLALLAGEALACAGIFLGVLHLLAPGRLAELRGLARTAIAPQREAEPGAAELDLASAEMLSEPPTLG